MSTTRTAHANRNTSLYILLLILGYIGCAGHRGRQSTISMAELKEHLQPPTAIGSYAGFDSATNVLYMGNRFIERHILMKKGVPPIQTIRYTYKPSGHNYVDLPSEEFRFRIGGLTFSGNGATLASDDHLEIEQKPGGVRRVTIQLTHTPAEGAKPIFHLRIHYEIYPDQPVIRKWLTIQNLTDSAFFLEDIEIESLSFFAERTDSLQIGGSDLKEMKPAPWKGGSAEAFVIVHASDIEGGVVLGNESAGLLKYYQVYSARNTVSIGLSPTTDPNGAEIRVPPKATVDSPHVWTLLFQGNPQTGFSETTRLLWGESTPTPPPMLMTQITPEWRPPQGLQRDTIIVVDYDWNIEMLEALKRMSEQVHAAGGKLGIRLPIAEINTAILERPAWQLTPTPVLRPMSGLRGDEGGEIERQVEGGKERKEGWKDGRMEGESSSSLPFTNHVSQSNGNGVIYCVLSGYGYYLTQAVNGLLTETKADVPIFDRPIIGSEDSPLKGCSAFGHEHYSRAESIGTLYRWIFELADYLHREYPELQVGITAMAYGVERPDAACLEHFDLFLNEP